MRREASLLGHHFLTEATWSDDQINERRHLQRLLVLPQLTSQHIWFPILKKWLKIHYNRKKICYLAIDRTRWQERNLFVVSLIKNKRALAYTCAVNKGQNIAFKGVKEYICRLPENFRKEKRHSNFLRA